MMFKWVGNLVDRLFAVTGALLFSQVPLFMQQYQQQLLGHVSELKIQLDAIKKAAALSGKNLPEYVLKFLNSGDKDFIHQGELMNQMIYRHENLMSGYNALSDASLYGKPFYFIKYLDFDIAQSTWKSFDFGFAFSLESSVYAIIGIIFGLTLYWILSRSVKSLLSPLFHKKIEAK